MLCALTPGGMWGCCGCCSHRAGRMLHAAGSGTSGRVLPHLQLTWGERISSLCWGSPRCRARWHVMAEHSSKAGLASRQAWPSCLLPRFTAVSAPQGPGGGAGAACSSQKGGRGMEHVLTCDSKPLASFQSLPPTVAPSLSPPWPGILHRPCWDGSRCGESGCQPPCWSAAPSVTAELVNMLHHC